MRRTTRNPVLRVTAALVAFYPITLPIAVYAQNGDISTPGYGKANKEAPVLPKAGPTPRTRDGHPDLSGVWFIGLTGTVDLTAQNSLAMRRFDPKVTPQEDPSFQPWVLLKQKRIGPQQQAEPCLTCEPLGVPGFVIKNPYPIQFVQTGNQLLMLAELDTTYRTIWVDGRSHPKDPDPKFNGDAVAHWEGDTLVVDVVAIDTHTWLTGPGGNIIWFPSDLMHVTERIWRPDSNTMMYQVTVDDPKVLTKPWKSAPNHYTIGQVPMGEYYCTNNQDDSILNPDGTNKFMTKAGYDERYFDEGEYQELLREAATPGKK